MNKKILLQVAMFVSLFFGNGMLYGRNRTLDYGDGVIYNGEVEYEELPEEGRFNFINWIIYKVFRVMEPHGRGKLTFKDGSFYEGNFTHGRMTGRGKRTFADGSFYEGDFRDGEMTGKGKIFGADGNIIQEGSFFNGQRVDSYSMFVRDGYVIYKDLITNEETVIKKTDKEFVEIYL